MYYNRILHRWIFDLFDYFLLSVLAGSLAASNFKDYLSEKKAMQRLKNSIIKKIANYINILFNALFYGYHVRGEHPYSQLPSLEPNLVHFGPFFVPF